MVPSTIKNWVMAYDKGKLSEVGSRDIIGGWAGSLLIDRKRI